MAFPRKEKKISCLVKKKKPCENKTTKLFFLGNVKYLTSNILTLPTKALSSVGFPARIFSSHFMFWKQTQSHHILEVFVVKPPRAKVSSSFFLFTPPRSLSRSPPKSLFLPGPPPASLCHRHPPTTAALPLSPSPRPSSHSTATHHHHARGMRQRRWRPVCVPIRGPAAIGLVPCRPVPELDTDVGRRVQGCSCSSSRSQRRFSCP